MSKSMLNVKVCLDFGAFKISFTVFVRKVRRLWMAAQISHLISIKLKNGVDMRASGDLPSPFFPSVPSREALKKKRHLGG